MDWPRVCSTRRSACGSGGIRRSSRARSAVTAAGRYRAVRGHAAACAGRERPEAVRGRAFALAAGGGVPAAALRRSPASIAGRLPTEYAADESCRVSHEAIYQWVYAQPVSTLARELISLRTGRTARAGGRRPPPRRGSASRSTSTNAPPKSQGARSPDTGKETWSSARTASPRSRRWSSGPPGSSSWCR